jgi:E1-E2 ATPase
MRLKAGQPIAALSDLAAQKARVLRDRGQRQIPAAEVVAGDMLVLAEGDIVPADADLVDAAALLVDEPRWPASPFRWTRRGDVGIDWHGGGALARPGGGDGHGAASSMGRAAALLGAQPGAQPAGQDGGGLPCRALLAAAGKLGLSSADVNARLPRLRKLPAAPKISPGTASASWRWRRPAGPSHRRPRNWSGHRLPPSPGRRSGSDGQGVRPGHTGAGAHHHRWPTGRR